MWTVFPQSINICSEKENKAIPIIITFFFFCFKLHIAAANGYVEVAEFLLDNHVAVDIEDNESWQPIHAASYWAQVWTVY